MTLIMCECLERQGKATERQSNTTQLAQKRSMDRYVTWWFPCASAASASLSQQALSSRARAASRPTYNVHVHVHIYIRYMYIHVYVTVIVHIITSNLSVWICIESEFTRTCILISACTMYVDVHVYLIPSMILRQPYTHIYIATLQGKSKLGPFILDKVQCYLWVALLLQVGNDTLPHQLGTAYHVQHLYTQRHIYVYMFM